MAITISKPIPEISVIMKNAFFFAEKIFNKDDIDYSILTKFSGSSDFKLTDEQVHFLSILLEQYQKVLIRKKKETPKHLRGYQQACEALPIVSDLLLSLDERFYRLTDLEKDLYKKLFDLSQAEEYHVDFDVSKYQDRFSEIRLALHNLESAGILFILDESDAAISVELTPDYCYSSLEF